MSKIEPLSLEGLITISLKDRPSLVHHHDFGRPLKPGGSFHDFVERLPRILAGNSLREVARLWAEARRRGRAVLLGMGAHPLKVGLSPLLIDLVVRGLLTGLALNGAGIIHDAEIAMAGGTSEDVPQGLGCGRYGMARETADFLNGVIAAGAGEGLGLGEAVGRAILESDFPYKHLSLLAAARQYGVPVTVHVAVGTDIIHLHPTLDPRALGAATHLDFRLFAAQVARLSQGMYINLGSAVVLPEVFLKALTLARNLGHRVEGFATVNLDFIQHYRPLTNVVHRPAANEGQGFALTGHHEIMVPLLAGMVLEMMEEKPHAD